MVSTSVYREPTLPAFNEVLLIKIPVCCPLDFVTGRVYMYIEHKQEITLHSHF